MRRTQPAFGRTDDALPLRRRIPAHWLLIAVPAAVLLVFFVLPNALLLSASFLKSEAQQLTNELDARQLRVPVHAAALSRGLRAHVRRRHSPSALLDVLLGYPLAYFLVRTRSRWKGLLIALSLAPLLASVVVRTYGWYIILNRFGVANDVLLGLRRHRASGSPFMPSTGAIIVGLAHALLPYTVLTIMGSLQRHQPESRVARR